MRFTCNSVGHSRDNSRTQGRKVRSNNGSLGSALDATLAAHMNAETMSTAHEKRVAICTRFVTTSYALKAPTIQLACKRRELGLLVKVFGENLECKCLFAKYDKATTVRKPRDHA